MSLANTTRVLSGKWKRLATGTVNRRIFGALVIVGVLTFGVKLASMVKDVIVAASFGTGNALDAFFIAFLLPTYAINVVAGSFNAALIPIYIHTREHEGQAAAQRLFSGVVILSTGLLIIMTTFLALVGPYLLPFLGSGFDPEKLALTRGLFYILLPAIIITGLSTIWGAVLNAGERFALASSASIMVPIASIVSLLALGSDYGIHALAFGTILGFGLELFLLGRALRRQGLQLWPHWYGIQPPVRRAIDQYLPMAAGMVLMSSTVLVGQAMAAMLAPGSVAVLSYGNKLVALILGIGTTALATAVSPYFSKMVAVADWGGVRYSLKIYSRLIILLTVPFTCFVYLLSTPIVHLLFERGAFTESDTVLVSQVQAMYVLQMPFYALSILFVRLISSLQANHILMWGTVINCVLNILFNYLLIQVLGIAGIALSTTLVYIVSCGFLSIMLYRKLKKVEEQVNVCVSRS